MNQRGAILSMLNNVLGGLDNSYCYQSFRMYEWYTASCL